MSQTVMKNPAETITESAQQASRVTGAITDAIENGAGMVSRVAKHGSDAAEEFLNDTTGRLQRRLALTVAATFTFGVATGALIGWTMKRK